MPERREEIRASLEWLFDQAENRANQVRLIPLPNLMSAMMRELVSADNCLGARPSLALLEDELRNTIAFENSDGVRCTAYHEELDCSNKCCALGTAIMTAFAFCKYMCPKLSQPISLKARRHVPE